MDEQERDDAMDHPDPSAPDVAPPGRATRPPGEGPAGDGGSGLEGADEPAEEEIGGGD